MWFAIALSFAACSGNQAPVDAAGGMDMAGVAVVGQIGRVVDYFEKTPQAGFTVTDGTNTTTTDSDGRFVLPAPTGEKLAPVITGPSYTQLFLPEATVIDSGIDRGEIPIPTAASLNLAQQVTGADTTKAIVYITLIKTGACTSLAGGTLTVQSPAGTSVGYFTPQGLPTGSAFIDRTGNLPVAVVYNVPPGEDVTFTLENTPCQLAPDMPVRGGLYTGHVQTAALEPGSNNSSLIFAVE